MTQQRNRCRRRGREVQILASAILDVSDYLQNRLLFVYDRELYLRGEGKENL